MVFEYQQAGHIHVSQVALKQELSWTQWVVFPPLTPLSCRFLLSSSRLQHKLPAASSQ